MWCEPNMSCWEKLISDIALIIPCIQHVLLFCLEFIAVTDYSIIKKRATISFPFAKVISFVFDYS